MRGMDWNNGMTTIIDNMTKLSSYGYGCIQVSRYALGI